MALGYKKEMVCACQEPVPQGVEETEDVVVSVRVFGEEMWVPVDTAALSIWVDHDWFIQNGGKVSMCEGTAEAVDGHRLKVEGVGMLTFELWGRMFDEEVRVLSRLPDKLLIDRKFWRRNALCLDLAANRGVIRVGGARYEGLIEKGTPSEATETICRVLKGADVDQHLKHESDYSEFSSDLGMQQKLKDLLWENRDIFKGLGRIKGVKHEIILKENARPICQPLRKRSPKEQDVEREAVKKLIELGVLEPSTPLGHPIMSSYERKTGAYVLLQTFEP